MQGSTTTRGHVLNSIDICAGVIVIVSGKGNLHMTLFQLGLDHGLDKQIALMPTDRTVARFVENHKLPELRAVGEVILQSLQLCRTGAKVCILINDQSMEEFIQADLVQHLCGVQIV